MLNRLIKLAGAEDRDQPTVAFLSFPITQVVFQAEKPAIRLAGVEFSAADWWVCCSKTPNLGAPAYLTSFSRSALIAFPQMS
jgi:hypothetical protein